MRTSDEFNRAMEEPVNKKTPFALTLAVAIVLSAMAIPACAQITVTPSPASLSFSAQVGDFFKTQNLTLSATAGTTVNYAAQVQTTTGGPWLAVSPVSGTLPTNPTLTVYVNPYGLQAGVYQGAITFTFTSGTLTGINPITVQVTLTVGSGTVSPLIVNPASMSFSYTTGGSQPAAQALNVTSAGSIAFSATATTAVGSGWLTVNPTSGSTPVTLSVSVNTTGLSSGTYTGNVVLTPLVAGGAQQTVSVTLTVNATPQLTASTSSVTLNYQIGAQAPSQTVTLTSGGADVYYSATATTSSGGNWLVVSPTGGVAGSGTTVSPAANLTVSLNSAILSALSPRAYDGAITIQSPSATPTSQVISVRLNVSLDPFINASPAALSFTVTPGATLPAAQTVQLSTTAGTLPVGFTASPSVASTANWLSVSPTSGSTPATLSVSLNAVASTMLPGTYDGVITISASIVANPTLSIPVRLTVSNVPALTVFPRDIFFNFQTGRTLPSAQTVAVASTGVPTSFSVVATTASGGSWLNVFPSAASTPQTLTVFANPTGLAAGTYTGTLTITPSQQGAVAQTVNVSLRVSDTALVNVSPGALSLSLPQGSPPTTQNIAVTSTGDNIQFSMGFTTTSGGSSWLLAGPITGTTPANLTVYIQPQGLPVGIYSGSITVTASNANTQVIPVSLAITTGATLGATPSSLSFTQAQGGGAPDAKTVSLTASTGVLSFSATATTNVGGNWLSVTPIVGSTPATLSVSASGASLAQGTYTGQITVQSQGATNSPMTIPVVFTVGPAQTISLTPATLTFNSQQGATAPPAQSVSVGSSGGALNFTAAAATSTGGGWLSVSPGSGTTPASLSISVTPGTLSAGTYAGTVTVSSAAAGNSPQTVSVTLVIAGAPAPSVATVMNAASALPTAAAPGLIVSVFGANLGPTAGVSGRVVNGLLETTVAETRVLFDGIPAPLLYVRADQINVIVPYAVAGRFSTQMQIEYRGTRSNPVSLQVVDAAPGLFTLNNQGTGQGAILNQDFLVNGASNAAPRTSVVMIYATGEGQTSPTGVDGRVASSTPYPAPLLPVRVFIGDREAQVLYAGAAPGFVAGAMQINALIPPDAPTGSSVPVTVTIGTRNSQSAATIAIR